MSLPETTKTPEEAPGVEAAGEARLRLASSAFRRWDSTSLRGRGFWMAPQQRERTKMKARTRPITPKHRASVFTHDELASCVPISHSSLLQSQGGARP